jgi:hypothetical protein
MNPSSKPQSIKKRKRKGGNFDFCGQQQQRQRPGLNSFNFPRSND